MIKNVLKNILAILYIITIFILIVIPIKYYTDWVFRKNTIWIILITIVLIVIATKILNKIAFVVGKLSTSIDLMSAIDLIITLIARVLYAYILYNQTNLDNSHEITISIFMFFLYFCFTRFFNHGLMYYVIKYTKLNNILTET